MLFSDMSSGEWMFWRNLNPKRQADLISLGSLAESSIVESYRWMDNPYELIMSKHCNFWFGPLSVTRSNLLVVHFSANSLDFTWLGLHRRVDYRFDVISV